MPRYTFDLAISADEFLRYYRGSANAVRVMSHSGQVIHFPATALRPFVTHNGIHGRFQIETDERNRLIRLIRTY